MSTSFTPPRPDQWEGPAAGQQDKFVPPPISSWQGPAPNEQVTSSIHYLATPDSQPPAQASEASPISKAATAFWQGIGGQAAMDILGGASRDPKRAQKALETVKAIAGGIAAEPGRVWDELSRTGESMVKGDLSGTAFHLAGAVPFLGAPAQQVGMDLDRGDPAAAVGHTAALVVPMVAGPLAEATGRAAATTGTAVRGAVIPALKAAAERPPYGAGFLGYQLGGPKGAAIAAAIAKAPSVYRAGMSGARGALAERAAAVAAQTAAEQAAREAADAALAQGARVTDAQDAMVNPPRQLPPGPIITPAPPDASFVRSVPAEYPPVELTAQEQALAAHILQNVEPLPPRLALPPAPARVIVPEAPAPIPDTSFVRGVPAQLPEIIPPALRTNAPAEAAATTLRDLMQQSGTAPPPETAPAPEPAPIDFATAGRAAKTDKIFQLLRDKQIPAEMAQQAPADWWNLVADQAGVAKPSQTSIGQVLKRLEDAERPAPVELPASVNQLPPAEAETALQSARVKAQPASGVRIEPQPGAAEGIHSTLDSAADAAMQRMRDRGTFTGSKLSAGIPVDDLADMAIWGASKLAKGTVDFAKWSKEILAEAGPAAAKLAPELPKLYAQAQKTLDRHIANTAGDLPNTQKLLTMYRKGIEGQDWYRSTKAELQSVFGPDTNMFIDFLAATSPNTTVAANTTLALKAYMQWKAGKPFTGYLPETIKSLEKAAAGEDFGALKVRSFRKNLHGDPMPVTVDRWIARALGFGDQPTPPQYKFMDYLLTQIAQKKGLEPRQVQAAIWKTIKDAEGLAGQGGESYEVLVRKKLLSDPDLAAAIKQATSLGQ